MKTQNPQASKPATTRSGKTSQDGKPPISKYGLKAVAKMPGRAALYKGAVVVIDDEAEVPKTPTNDAEANVQSTVVKTEPQQPVAAKPQVVTVVVDKTPIAQTQTTANADQAKTAAVKPVKAEIIFISQDETYALAVVDKTRETVYVPWRNRRGVKATGNRVEWTNDKPNFSVGLKVELLVEIGEAPRKGDRRPATRWVPTETIKQLIKTVEAAQEQEGERTMNELAVAMDKGIEQGPRRR